jgi:Winged helix-turn helix
MSSNVLNPPQLKFPVALRTGEMVVQLICDKFDFKFAANFVGHLLAELGVTPQRPLHRAMGQGPTHRGTKTKASVAMLGGKLRLFNLPSYPPDRDPPPTNPLIPLT